MASEKETKKLMRKLQGLSSESSNNENTRKKGKKGNSSNESSSDESSNNGLLFGRAPPVFASRKAFGAAAASGQGAASGRGAAASRESTVDGKIKAAFALYEMTKEDLKKLGDKGKDTIRKKFLKIAQKNHPDKWSNKPNNNTKKAATKRFKEYSEARDIINKEMGWVNNFEAEKQGGTRKKTRKI